MSDISVTGVMMDRRQMTKFMFMVSSGMALAPLPGMAAAADTNGFNDSGAELLAFMKLQSRADTGYTNYFNVGTVYAAVPGRPSLPLYGYEGLLRFHTRVVDANHYEVTFVEAGTYLDLKTGERLDRFQNPMTGIENPVDHIVEGPMSWQWTSESLNVKEPLPILHRRVEWQHFAGESWLHFDNILTGKLPGDPIDHPAALVTYVGSTAQLRDKSRRSVDNTVLIDSSVNPWAPWLKMGAAPGRLANNIVGRKLGALSEAPDRLIKHIAARSPKVLDTVQNWAAAS